MAATSGTIQRLVVGLVVAATLLLLPPGWQNVGAVGARAFAPDTCSRTGEVRATTCRLVPGQPLDDVLTGGEPSIYRLDVLQPSQIDLVLTGDPGTMAS